MNQRFARLAGKTMSPTIKPSNYYRDSHCNITQLQPSSQPPRPDRTEADLQPLSASQPKEDLTAYKT